MNKLVAPSPITATSPAVLSGAGDRIELMQTFVRIVEAGNLSAAASQLRTTQPTVSRRLQTLERSLGVRLLQRSTHAMRLTEDGQRCYERAKDLLASWAAFESDLRGAGDEPQGVLRVVVPHAIGQDSLIQPLAEYLSRYPQVRVDWLLHDDSVLQDFIAGGVDCAVQVGEVSDPALVVIKLAEVPRIVVAAPSVLAGAAQPKEVSDLAQVPWLALRTFYQNEVALRHRATGEIQRLTISPRMSTDNLFALRSAVLNGMGVGVASAWALTDELASGRLIHLLPDWQAAPLPVYLVYPYASFYPARLRRFVEIVRTSVPVWLPGTDSLSALDVRDPVKPPGPA